MLNPHFRTCGILFASLTIATGSAVGDILLVEFGWAQPEPVTLPASYNISVGYPFGGFGTPQETGRWIESYPSITPADPVTLREWNLRLTGGLPAGLSIANGDQNPGALGCCFDVDYVLGGSNKLWADGREPGTPSDGGQWIAATYVPQKGNNQALWGYQITGIERIITAESQIVRIIGINIPEPATWVAMLLFFVLHFSGRFLRRRS